MRWLLLYGICLWFSTYICSNGIVLEWKWKESEREREDLEVFAGWVRTARRRRQGSLGLPGG